MKITEKIDDFVTLSAEEKHEFFQQIWNFDQEIFPTGCIEYLYDYMHDIEAFSIPVVRYFVNGKLVGQNIIRILKMQLEQRPVFIVDSRAGFLNAYRRKNLSLHSAIGVAIRHKIKYPHIGLWFVPTIMQPKVYMLFASRSSNFYPRAQCDMPQQHEQILQLMLKRKKQVQRRSHGVYVYPCDLPKFDAEHLIRLRNQAETHVNFFMRHIPDYFDGLGMLCVCELDMKTILETTINLIFDRRLH